MRSLRISFDIDGVLANFVRASVDVANSIWPGRLPEDFQPTGYDYPGVFDKSDWDQVWGVIKKDPCFWENLYTLEDNVCALRAFLSGGNDRVFFITSRMATGGVSAFEQTDRWLYKNVFEESPNLIVVAKSEEKYDLMREFKIQYSIDDLGPTVEACNKIEGHAAYLLDQPWNQGYSEPRVNSVQDFVEILKAAKNSWIK